jgi:hypothetical protein
MSSVAISGSKQPDFDHRALAEGADRARHGEDPAPDALGAAEHRDDRGELRRLDLGQQVGGVGDLRIARHGGDAPMAEVTDEVAERVRPRLDVGVHDADDLGARDRMASLSAIALPSLTRLATTRMSPRAAWRARISGVRSVEPSSTTTIS